MRDARQIDRLGKYLAETVARRQYIAHVSIGDLRSRHMDSVLGNVWHLLNPILQVAVYFVIFGVVLQTDRDVDNFLTFLSIGVFAFTFSQRSTMAGSRCLQRNRGLINLISFPRAILPLTSTLTEALTAIPAFLVMLALALVTGETPTLAWLLVGPIYLLQCLFNTGASMVAARAAYHVADIQQLLPFLFRLAFYASGVLFNVHAYVESSRYRLLFELNPFYCFIEMYRAAVLGSTIDVRVVAAGFVWALALALAGFVWFRAGEEEYGSE